jgi:hypothetical protein
LTALHDGLTGAQVGTEMNCAPALLVAFSLSVR